MTAGVFTRDPAVQVLRDATQSARRIVSHLLADARVFGLVQRGLTLTLEARRRFDRNVSRMLATVSIISQQDVAQLDERVQALDRTVDTLLTRVERLIEARKAATAANQRPDADPPP